MNCIRVLGGYTDAESVETVFNADNFIESEFLKQIHEISGNISMSLNWYEFPIFFFFD